MNSTKHFFGCAMIAGVAGIVCAQAHAQSPFAESASPNTDEKPSDKAAEKSVLAGSAKESLTPESASESFCQCIDEIDKASLENIERALRGPVHSSGLDFVEQPLTDVITALQDDYGISIKLDTPALDENGIAADAPVSVSLHNVSLRSALRLLLKPLKLTYIIRDEVLVITTTQEAEKQLKTCVYNVAGLTGERDSQMDAIIDTIVSCVAKDSWAENGGASGADIRAMKPGLLVISQTQPVHDEIRNLLATIRKMRDTKSSKTNSAAIEPHAADEVVTRSYLLQLNPSNDNATMRSQVRELIVQSLPEETWSGRLADGQAVTLTVFHDRVVVRQTPKVQDDVQNILTDAGVAVPAPTDGGNSGFRGFGFGGGGGGFGRGIGPEGGAAGHDPAAGFGTGGPASGAGEGGVPAGAAPGIGGGGFGTGPNPF